MSTAEILKTYPPAGLVLARRSRPECIPDDVKKGDLKKTENEEKRDALKAKVIAFAASRATARRRSCSASSWPRSWRAPSSPRTSSQR